MLALISRVSVTYFTYFEASNQEKSSWKQQNMKKKTKQFSRKRKTFLGDGNTFSKF